MAVQLDELRERAEGLMMTHPAEVTQEMTWLVGELESMKDVLLTLIDYLAAERR